MEKEIEPNFEGVTEQHLAASVRAKVVAYLLDELGAEMRSLDPDWEKVERVLAKLLGLKKTEELVVRLQAEVRNPAVKWEAVRELMAQLWSKKRDILIDLLPSLLQS